MNGGGWVDPAPVTSTVRVSGVGWVPGSKKLLELVDYLGRVDARLSCVVSIAHHHQPNNSKCAIECSAYPEFGYVSCGSRP